MTATNDTHTSPPDHILVGGYDATVAAHFLVAQAADEDDLDRLLADAEQDALADESRGYDMARIECAALVREVARISPF